MKKSFLLLSLLTFGQGICASEFLKSFKGIPPDFVFGCDPNDKEYDHEIAFVVRPTPVTIDDVNRDNSVKTINDILKTDGVPKFLTDLYDNTNDHWFDLPSTTSLNLPEKSLGVFMRRLHDESLKKKYFSRGGKAALQEELQALVRSRAPMKSEYNREPLFAIINPFEICWGRKETFGQMIRYRGQQRI